MKTLPRAVALLLLVVSFSFTREVLPAAPPPAVYAKGAVAADSEVASEVGAKVLASGGDAVDAAIATALALGVVHPHSSGIGGGGFMVVYRADEKKTYVLDFREVAPAAATPSMYERDGKTDGMLARVGGLAVGVPGEVAGFVEAHKKWGKRPWKELVAPSVKLARDGFLIDGALSQAIDAVWPELEKSPSLKEMFSKAFSKKPEEGDRWKRPDLAKTLEALGKDPSSFYKGALSKAIVEAVKKEGGILTEEDLKNYQPVWREPVRGEYRGYEVLSVPPPSSGGVVLIEILNILENFDLKSFGLNSSTYLHLLAEASQHGFADRARELGDPAFTKVPVEKMTSQTYADELAAKITERTHPAGYYGMGAQSAEDGGTTHLSVIDARGNAVALTTTVNLYFGARVVVGGFPLNDEMDDFSLSSGEPNAFGLVGSSANAIAAGKRPLSSMSPTILLKDGQPVLVLGASGGSRIISGVLQVIVNVVDFGADVSRAVDLPRAHHQWKPGKLFVEPEIPRDVQEGLRARGHEVQELPPGYQGAVGIVQAVAKDLKTGKVSAASDPRKGGAPAGH